MLLTIGERAERAIGELANVALRPAEHEAVRPEVLEHRDGAVSVHRAAEHDGLLRLKKCEVRAGGSALRTADARRERVVTVGPREARTQRLRVGARVDGARKLAQRGDDPGPRPYDPRVGDEFRDRDAQARRRGRVP